MSPITNYVPNYIRVAVRRRIFPLDGLVVLLGSPGIRERAEAEGYPLPPPGCHPRPPINL